ncbi:hypothetical protein GGS21DRAFT_548872 [Xylaria nigripes]|nr:hypothetical protein GGS21DRAFT_548872 [Xylaria nigripes]
MGAKASKPAQTASRRFPTRAPGTSPGPVADLDASPPNKQYSERLRKMGVATPQPTYSHSSTAGPFSGPSPAPSTYTQTSSSLSPPSHQPRSQAAPSYYPTSSQNRTLNALEARRELQARADAEFNDMSRGREFLDAPTLRRALALQARGVSARDIEATLRLKSGVVARLGTPGVFVPVEGSATIKQAWGPLLE